MSSANMGIFIITVSYNYIKNQNSKQDVNIYQKFGMRLRRAWLIMMKGSLYESRIDFSIVMIC